MAIVLRFIAILIGLYLLYVIVHTINNAYLNKRKLNAFTLLLPKKCYLFIRGKNGGQYVRGYYINDSNPTITSSTINLTGHDVNPELPVIKTQLGYKSVRIPHEVILNDLVDVKYIDETGQIIKENKQNEENIINERKKKKGSR